MTYKVLYIDDDSKYLLGTLGRWNELSTQENADNTSYPLMQFAGLASPRNSENNKEEVNVDWEMHYIDNDARGWDDLTPVEQDELQAKLFPQFLEKITEVQPDAIVLDIDLGARAVLNGGLLLEAIRKYYPYMAIVMATRTPYVVPYDKRKDYPLAEGLLNFSDSKPDSSYEIVRKQCSHAINYRGISLQEYKDNKIDHRLPNMSWEFIQEIAQSPFFDTNTTTDYPLIFLHGSFGSGRRLFALWISTLLQRRRGEECFPSRLTEINCTCFSTSFNDDEAKKGYLKKLFEPSRDRVLFLTDVDRVPDTMQEAFKSMIKEWGHNACIIATATDSKRIGLERLPKGIKQIESFDDWKSLKKPKKEPKKESKKRSKDYLLPLLPSSSVEDFKKQLTAQNIPYRTVDCSNFDYADSLLRFEKESARLQNNINESKENHGVLVVNNITALEQMPDKTKKQFKDWIDSIKENICVMVNRIYNTGTANRLLPEVLLDYQLLESQEDVEKLKIEHGKVFYFSRTTRTDNTDFSEFIKEKFDANVWIFDCEATFRIDTQYLEEKLMPGPAGNEEDLLLLENVDRVPDDYLDIFKAAVKNCQKTIQFVPTVSDSRAKGLENLPDDHKINEITLPSLQERFEGNSMQERLKANSINSDDITSFLDSAFPTWQAIVRRFPRVDEIQQLHSEINQYYQDRLKSIDRKKLKTQEQQKIDGLQKHLKDNQNKAARSKFFFQELCQSIVKRVAFISYRSDLRCNKISINAELFLAIQFHDWPEVIFNISRGIYDLEEIVKDAVENAIVRNIEEADISDIKISDFAPQAEEIINNVRADSMGRKKELGFEVLTRAYAREYQSYQDNPMQYDSGYKKKLSADYKPPPFEAKPLIESLRGTYKQISPMGILNDLNRIVASARRILNYEECD